MSDISLSLLKEPFFYILLASAGVLNLIQFSFYLLYLLFIMLSLGLSLHAVLSSV